MRVFLGFIWESFSNVFDEVFSTFFCNVFLRFPTFFWGFVSMTIMGNDYLRESQRFSYVFLQRFSYVLIVLVTLAGKVFLGFWCDNNDGNQNPIKTFTTFYFSLRRFETYQGWGPYGPIGPLWAHKGPYGPIRALMGP